MDGEALIYFEQQEAVLGVAIALMSVQIQAVRTSCLFFILGDRRYGLYLPAVLADLASLVGRT